MAGVMIVLGSAANALPELREAEAYAPGASIVVVNDSFRAAIEAGVPRERIAAFATLHHERLERFLRGLPAEGLPVFVHEEPVNAPRLKRRLPDNLTIYNASTSGTSGLYAGRVALSALGARGVIFAGVPLDHAAGVNYRLPPGKSKWADGLEARYHRGWKALPDEDRARMRSMSGWTREFLGAPTIEWVRAL